MKRFVQFFVGLWIVVVTGVFLFIYIDYEPIAEYQRTLQRYDWFEPALYWTAGLLAAFGLLLLLLSFRPSYKSRGLVMSYDDGELFINKKSIEKNVLHTVRQYSDVRQPSIKVDLYQKRQSSYMDVFVEAFVTNSVNAQSYIEALRQDIKASAESFAELPVREVKIHVLDQKTLKKRVL
ncbi:MAG: alkaline shock response membrane anchor protein AmaP [Caryophanon sp.]|nr:alkaline shock response membrane anchor protein AmaP [Caryophanon sp.]